MRRVARIAAALALAVSARAAAEEPALADLLAEAWKTQRGGSAASARPLFEQALVRARDEGSAAAESEALRGIAAACTTLGDYVTAQARLDEALPLAQASGSRPEVGRVLNAQGSVAWYGNIRAARPFYERALLEFEAAGDLEGAANTIANIVLTLVQGEEEEWIERGLALAIRSGSAYHRARFLQQRGDVKRARGDFAGARESLLEAQRLFQQAGRIDAQATVLNSLGYLHRLHGRPDQALEFQRQSLELARQLDDPFVTVRGLTGIAIALRDLRRYPEALATIEEGLVLATAAGQRAHVLNFREMQAHIELELGRPARAAELLAQLPLDESATYRAGRRCLMAAALRRSGRPAEALVQADKAIELARANPALDGMPVELAERAYCLDALGRPLEALADGRAALEEIERLRQKLVPDDFMRQGYGERVQEIYVFVVGVLQRLGRTDEALEAASRARARAFLDRLGTRSAADGAAPGRVAPATVAEVRAAARRLDSTVLVYFVGPSDAYVWAVPADGPVVTAKVPATAQRLASLVDGASVGGAGASRRGRSTELPTRAGGVMVLGGEEERWRQLYDLLVRPVRRSLPPSGARLTVIPDGPLLRLPFSALRDGSGRYLVERYAIHYAPAVGTFEQTARRRTAGATGGTLLVGDPERYPDSGEGSPLQPLPGSRRELDGIARLLGPDHVERLSGGAATEARLRERVHGMDVLHFSTHGVVRDDAPLESFVALSPGAGGERDDGRLTSADVYGLDLTADLVFLSACRTARGGVSADGVMGLTRAFFHAGASSIVATLSDVVDEPAQRLVADFYRARLSGEDKVTALRDAQLAMLRALRAGQVSVDTPAGPVTLPESPALWAPFVLLGEP